MYDDVLENENEFDDDILLDDKIFEDGPREKSRKSPDDAYDLFGDDEDEEDEDFEIDSFDDIDFI